MCRRAFARHRMGAALLLALSLRAPSVSAEPAKPDDTRVGTVAPSFLHHLRVPHLHRIGWDPSVQHLGSIDPVDRYPGGSPVRFDARGLIPFARGRGRLLLALLSLFRPEVKLDDRDHRTRATDEPSARDRFSALGAGSYVVPGEKRHGILSRLGDACRPKITFTW